MTSRAPESIQADEASGFAQIPRTKCHQSEHSEQQEPSLDLSPTFVTHATAETDSARGKSARPPSAIADEVNSFANTDDGERHHILIQSLKSGVSTLASA
jgi:hypothetical protein